MHKYDVQMLCTDVETELGIGGGSENSEKLKIAFWVEGTFGHHFSLLAILDGSHYKKSQKWQLQLLESI